MASIHEAAKAHGKKARGELTSLDVPELGEGFQIFYYPGLTGREVSRLFPAVDFSNPEKSSMDVACKALAICARDKDGSPLFSRTNEHEIADEWDPDLVVEIVDKMGVVKRAFGMGEEEAKND